MRTSLFCATSVISQFLSNMHRVDGFLSENSSENQTFFQNDPSISFRPESTLRSTTLRPATISVLEAILLIEESTKTIEHRQGASLGVSFLIDLSTFGGETVFQRKVKE